MKNGAVLNFLISENFRLKIGPSYHHADGHLQFYWLDKEDRFQGNHSSWKVRSPRKKRTKRMIVSNLVYKLYPNLHLTYKMLISWADSKQLD